MKEEEACSGTIKQSCNAETLNIFIYCRLKQNQLSGNIWVLYDGDESIDPEFIVYALRLRKQEMKR